ncbi:MAG: hypothetical protein ACJ72Z_01260, partial [Pyrinomonadaceae bacterium]
FFDEVRSVELSAGSRRKIVMNVRPQMAVLTFKTNVPDAEIAIENEGRFTRPLKRYLIKPGKYRIGLKRRGYLSQTVTADLTIPGKEQNIFVVLEPLRIDMVLAQANEFAAKGDLKTAADLLNDVLLQNNSHARANLLFGMIEYQRGNLASITYLLKAIKGGETVSFPINVQLGSDLVFATLRLDRDAVVFESKIRVDLNFSIARQQIESILRIADGNSLTYVGVSGNGDFYGRRVHREIKIYPANANIDSVSKSVSCGGSSNGPLCAKEVEMLFKLISAWKNIRS